MHIYFSIFNIICVYIYAQPLIDTCVYIKHGHKSWNGGVSYKHRPSVLVYSIYRGRTRETGERRTQVKDADGETETQRD